MSSIAFVAAHGDPFALGRQHGAARAAELHAFIDDGVCRLNRVMQAPVSIAALAPAIAGYDAAIAAATPALADEILGLAAGAGISHDEALLLQLRREIMGYSKVPTSGDCTTYARSAEAAAGEPVLAQTVDLNGNLDDQIGVLEIAPAGTRRRALVLTFGGLLGYLGINSDGLAVGLNLVLGGDWRPGVPPYLAIRHLLDAAASVDEAIAILGELRLASSRSIMLCDPRRTAYVEILGDELRVVEAPQSAHTNHFLHPDLVPSDELNVFARNSSRRRLQACEAGLAGLAAQAGVEEHFALLSAPPICVSDAGDIRRERTVAAVVMLPARGELHVRPGDPSARGPRSSHCADGDARDPHRGLVRRPAHARAPGAADRMPAARDRGAAAMRRLRSSRVLTAVGGEILLSYLGYFGLLPFLPIMLSGELDAPASQVGALLFVFAFATRASSILIGGLLDGFPVRRVLVGALTLSAVAFLAMSVTNAAWQLFPCLALAGAGISVQGILGRSLLADRITDQAAALRAFSLLNVLVNVAAASAPLIATLVFSAGGAHSMFLAVACCYVAGALVVVLVLPAERDAKPASAPVRWGLQAYRELWRDARFRRLSVVNFTGWFMYAQLFSALPIYLYVTLGASAAFTASFFVVNGILVVLAQMPVTALVQRFLPESSGRAPGLILPAGITLLAASFLILAASGGHPWALYAGIAVFTIGETLFIPTSDTAFAAIAAPGNRVLAFNGKKLTTAIGEASGTLCGASVSLALASSTGNAAYWLLIGSLGVLSGPLLVRLLAANSRPQSDDDASPHDRAPADSERVRTPMVAAAAPADSRRGPARRSTDEYTTP